MLKAIRRYPRRVGKPKLQAELASLKGKLLYRAGKNTRDPYARTSADVNEMRALRNRALQVAIVLYGTHQRFDAWYDGHITNFDTLRPALGSSAVAIQQAFELPNGGLRHRIL